jgi:hypothetical protein
MGKKRAGKGGAKAKAASSGGSKKAQQKRKTQQVATVPKYQQNSQQNNGKGKTKAKALTPAERLAEMRRKLDGGKFRMLNEQLYTTTGNAAYSTFQGDPELFDVYHQGFREMADKWPTNPLDAFIDYVKCVVRLCVIWYCRELIVLCAADATRRLWWRISAVATRGWPRACRTRCTRSTWCPASRS